MRTIEHRVNPNVSPEMLQEAKNLRNLAKLIEGGTVIGIAYSWVDQNDTVLSGSSTFCADYGKLTLVGCVSQLLFKLNSVIRDHV